MDRELAAKLSNMNSINTQTNERPYNAGPLFVDSFEFFIENFRYSRRKPKCSPAPIEYWKQDTDIDSALMITRHEYETEMNN